LQYRLDEKFNNKGKVVGLLHVQAAFRLVNPLSKGWVSLRVRLGDDSDKKVPVHLSGIEIPSSR
jgi:hypothetical protein